MPFQNRDPYGNFLGQLGAQNHGGYWQANQAAYGGAFGSPNYDAFLRAYAQRLATQQAGALAPAPPPEPIEYAGIRAGEIEAWRCWKLSHRLYLKSMSRDEVWAPGETMAGPMPEGYHTAGVHGWKSESGAFTYGLPSAAEQGKGSRVFLDAGSVIIIGRVHLWGEVVEHEHGYRAEFARIISLDRCLGTKWRGLKRLKKLREVYGIKDAHGKEKD